MEKKKCEKHSFTIFKLFTKFPKLSLFVIYNILCENKNLGSQNFCQMNEEMLINAKYTQA